MRIRLRYIVLLILAVMAGNSAWIGADSRDRFGDETSSIQYPRDRSYDIRHMVLDLSFDWDRQWVGGDVTFTLTPLAKPLRRVELDSADLTIWQVREGVEETLPHRVFGHRLEVGIIFVQKRMRLRQKKIEGWFVIDWIRQEFGILKLCKKQ